MSRTRAKPKIKKQAPRASHSRLTLPSRVVIENIHPIVDGGRFPTKGVQGECLRVEADIYVDGHDELTACLLYRNSTDRMWHTVPMVFIANDRWWGKFLLQELGCYEFALEAWVDRFKSWRRDLKKRADAQQVSPVDLEIGACLVKDAADRATESDRSALLRIAKELTGTQVLSKRAHTALGERLAKLMQRYPLKREAIRLEQTFKVNSDPPKASYSSWYEVFPRSLALQSGQHGTFKDCERRLDDIAKMGFDVLYFPPIHPVGMTQRKGKNNSPHCEPGDPGSPWAIGSIEGGHKTIHPQLGTLSDFKRLVKKARTQNIDIALDLAFQVSPDHPYVKEYPSWFVWRPDGTVQYAENPPKKYQDIYPLNFETSDWEALWQELKSIVLFWIKQGVRIFRVDNPHTKPFRFWEWLITEVKLAQPDVIFLSEAFTRPKIMYQLAKIGFTQSYTYFTWRNTKAELEQYFTELAKCGARDYFRPNLWTNTPDILSEYLQHGGRPAFVTRVVLAATLGANYGIYGPAYELCENESIEPGKEEYLNSEKYEIKHWDTKKKDSLYEIISVLNRARRENPALQQDHNLRFLPVDNDQIIAYVKWSSRAQNVVVVVVNLDPWHVQSGWVELPLDDLELNTGQPYQMHDLLGEGRYLWQGPRNFVRLDPHILSAHLFCVRRKVAREQDFDYYR
jgi:starch synthase (maltosyl-transferring)